MVREGFQSNKKVFSKILQYSIKRERARPVTTESSTIRNELTELVREGNQWHSIPKKAQTENLK